MSEPKMGQLCWFGLDNEIGVFLSAVFEVANPYKNNGQSEKWYVMQGKYTRYKHCTPLTKQEIQQFMEKANEPTRL